ncbi:hypothetical protein UFOVP46_8 [uncultured Caudovirales phage]|uniref:Uncharacterized protein n=1 Tax=uncultured Caudovirales phage TaxID=2100421 RepID=A0A6J5KRI1_9CAUD|nr:hypothetical protein UFOVP46_8 [uncultured Caudovirales phage]
MAVEHDIVQLVNVIDKTQWTHSIPWGYTSQYGVMTRDMLRKLPAQKGLWETKTSGATGEQVTVQKTYADSVWYQAANIRSIIWRGWDVTKDLACIRPKAEESEQEGWGVPQVIAPVQGKTYLYGFEDISKIQAWLEEKNPHYIDCRPSIFKQLDTSRIPNFIAWGGTGEMGGSTYSSEECGIIAITCPDNPQVMHVMENNIVEIDPEGNLLITSLSNPSIKRYRLGDKASFAKCTCERSLQSISGLIGRERNLIVMPNGERKWALFGSQSMWDKYGIKRYQLTQVELTSLKLSVISEPLSEESLASLKKNMQEWLGYPFDITVVYVDSFPEGKFEEFKSLVS